MNESDTPGPETEPPRDRLSRLSEASLRILESFLLSSVQMAPSASQSSATVSLTFWGRRAAATTSVAVLVSDSD